MASEAIIRDSGVGVYDSSEFSPRRLEIPRDDRAMADPLVRRALRGRAQRFPDAYLDQMKLN